MQNNNRIIKMTMVATFSIKEDDDNDILIANLIYELHSHNAVMLENVKICTCLLVYLNLIKIT